MLRQVLSQLLGSRVVFRIYWREWWSEQGRSSFCPLAQIVDAAGFLLQLVHSLPGRGQAADAVKDGELCRCCPATCVGQSFNDLRPHKIFIQQFLLPGLSWHSEWETQINWNYKWVLVFAVECLIVLPMCAAYQQRCVSQMFTCASLRACACRTTGSH